MNQKLLENKKYSRTNDVDALMHERTLKFFSLYIFSSAYCCREKNMKERENTTQHVVEKEVNRWCVYVWRLWRIVDRIFLGKEYRRMREFRIDLVRWLSIFLTHMFQLKESELTKYLRYHKLHHLILIEKLLRRKRSMYHQVRAAALTLRNMIQRAFWMKHTI